MKQREFKQLKVWRALKRHPGMGRAEVAEVLKWKSLGATSNMLARLHKEGCIRKEGMSWGVRWFATDKRPQDQRGMNEVSLQNLKAQQKLWQDNLIKAARARGLHLIRRPHVRPKPVIALESAWGFMPFPGEFASGAASCSDHGREDAPSENEEAA